MSKTDNVTHLVDFIEEAGVAKCGAKLTEDSSVVALVRARDVTCSKCLAVLGTMAYTSADLGMTFAPLDLRLVATVCLLEKTQAELKRMQERMFPVLDAGMAVPWRFVAPYDAGALRNHQQTLERLAERGGLSPTELLCVIHGLSWRDRRWPNESVARAELVRWVDEQRANEG